MADPVVQIDPKTGERVPPASSGAIQIDPATGERVQSTSSTSETPPQSAWRTIGEHALDLGKGALKGAGSTANNIGSMLVPDAALKAVGMHVPTDQEKQGYFEPSNTTQAVGKGIEQAGEFLIPGAGEEKAVSLLPKGLQTAGKIGAAALSSGLVNKAQGGDFKTGAIGGGIGAGIGAGASALAPKIAEVALGIPKAARAFGKTPGAAIMSETRGIRPESIASSAEERLGQLRPQLETAAANSPNQVSLIPARQEIADRMLQAERENAPTLHGRLNEMGNTLAERFGTHQAIPPQISAREALDLKRGFGSEHASWNPEVHNPALSTGRHVYGMLDKAFDQAVPEGAGLNQRISSLIPVKQRAESIGRNASTMQRALGRFGAHTGALTMGGVGAAGGYREAGLPGAIAGGLTGVLVPELIASPEAQMAGARLMHNAGTLRPLVGGALQLSRKPKGIGDQQQ